VKRVAKQLPVVCVIFVALWVTGCANGKPASDPLSPSVYLDHALRVMRDNAIYSPAVNWPAVSAQAHKMAAGAKTPSDTYAAIIYALGQLRQAGDLHARFLNALEAKLLVPSGIGDSVPSEPPTVALVNARLGVVTLPGVGSSPRSPNSRRYVLSTLSRISALQTKDHPCGWIVDLRDDTGGDMYPMLLSVGPIIGEGRLIGFTGRKGFLYYVSYHDSGLSGGGYSDRAPVRVADISPAPPVAVLTGPATASAGETVAVAFRGRTKTRSFGSPTGGLTTGPHGYQLADAAEVFFATTYYVDRRGIVYRHPIKPDVPISDNTLGSSVEDVAQNWLMSTTACSQHH
jgi:carboxyl-terminal processing protease